MILTDATDITLQVILKRFVHIKINEIKYKKAVKLKEYLNTTLLKVMIYDIRMYGSEIWTNTERIRSRSVDIRFLRTLENKIKRDKIRDVTY